MTQTMFDRMTATPEAKRSYQQERTIVDVTEIICEIMQKENISRSQLAKRLRVTPSAVTQILDGRRNLTLRLLSDVLFVMGRRLDPMTCGLDDVCKYVRIDRQMDYQAPWNRVPMQPYSSASPAAPRQQLSPVGKLKLAG